MALGMLLLTHPTTHSNTHHHKEEGENEDSGNQEDKQLMIHRAGPAEAQPGHATETRNANRQAKPGMP